MTVTGRLAAIGVGSAVLVAVLAGLAALHPLAEGVQTLAIVLVCGVAVLGQLAIRVVVNRLLPPGAHAWPKKWSLPTRLACAALVGVFLCLMGWRMVAELAVIAAAAIGIVVMMDRAWTWAQVRKARSAESAWGAALDPAARSAPLTTAPPEDVPGQPVTSHTARGSSRPRPCPGNRRVSR